MYVFIHIIVLIITIMCMKSLYISYANLDYGNTAICALLLTVLLVAFLVTSQYVPSLLIISELMLIGLLYFLSITLNNK